MRLDKVGRPHAHSAVKQAKFSAPCFFICCECDTKKTTKSYFVAQNELVSNVSQSPLSEHSLLEVCIVNDILKKTEMPAVLSSCYYNNGIICQISQNPRIQLTTKSLPAVDSILQ